MVVDPDRDSLRSEMERLQTENSRLTGELAQMGRMNEIVAGILGHDLRNPLGAILMSATVLSRKVEDENLKRAIGRILTAGSRMNQMIAQLLDFARARTGSGIQLERARTDVAAVFQKTLDDLPENAGRDRVIFEADGDARGTWDGDRLGQVAFQLVGNALRHGTAGGGVRVRIDGRAPHEVEIQVSNVGAIAPELLPILFDPFLGAELGNRKGGLGVGLFLTREMVLAHGGKVEATVAGDTTEFTVRLPRES